MVMKLFFLEFAFLRPLTLPVPASLRILPRRPSLGRTVLLVHLGADRRNDLGQGIGFRSYVYYAIGIFNFFKSSILAWIWDLSASTSLAPASCIIFSAV